MLPSFVTKTDPLLWIERSMCVESVARRYCIPARTIRYAAEQGHLAGFRDPDTPGHKAWRFWRRDVERWLQWRARCN
jgi:hypothetical protein